MKPLPQDPLPALPPPANESALRALAFAPGAFDATLASANRWSFGAKFKNPFADLRLFVDQTGRVQAGTLLVRGERRALHAQEIMACNSQREAELRLSAWQLSRRQSEDAQWRAAASETAWATFVDGQRQRRTSWPSLAPGRQPPVRMLPPGFNRATPVPMLAATPEPAGSQRAPGPG